MLISVIIPNYNHARYLPQQIESVLNQTFQDIEVILMDDCSPDDSRSIIAAYAASDTRIRVVLNEHNSGSTFKQWNKSIAQARGTYVWLAESDDYDYDYAPRPAGCSGDAQSGTFQSPGRLHPVLGCHDLLAAPKMATQV